MKCGRKLKKSDTELMDKIVHGLSKEVKNFVVMKEAKNLEQVTKYARMGQSLVNGESSKVFSYITGGINSDKLLVFVCLILTI